MPTDTLSIMLVPPNHVVVLAGLEPVVALGLRRALLNAGVDSTIESGGPSEVAALAGRLQPHAVVLGLESRSSIALRSRIRRAAPDAKVLLLSREEDIVEVLDAGAERPRWISDAVAERLAGELRHPPTSPTRSPACPTT
jgi:DNA-binding NarL/FixJ family response regulator